MADHLAYGLEKLNALLCYLAGISVDQSLIIKRKNILTRTIPFIIVGLVVFVLYLLFFVNIGEMLSIIGRTNLTVYLFATFATILDMVFFALAWQFFLRPLSANVSFRKIFSYCWISSFIDLIVPAESVSGEISRIFFVTRDGVNAGKVVASVVTQRILGLLIVACTLAVGAFQMLNMQIPFPSIVQSLIYLVVSATVIFLFLMLLICIKENWTRVAVEKIIGFIRWATRGRWRVDGWKERASKAIDTFYESLRVLRANPDKLILPVIFSIYSWFFAIFVYYLVFAAIGYVLDWIVIIVGYSIIVTLKSIPVGVPAEVGVTEIAMTVIFGAFNVPLYISAAAVVLIRIITVWFRLILGFVAFQWVGVKTIIEDKNVFPKI